MNSNKFSMMLQADRMHRHSRSKLHAQHSTNLRIKTAVGYANKRPFNLTASNSEAIINPYRVQQT